MASKETNQISIRLDDDVKEDIELLRQEDIKGKLEMRATNPALYDEYHDEPTPPTRSELCKRILQAVIKDKAAAIRAAQSEASGATVNV